MARRGSSFPPAPGQMASVPQEDQRSITDQKLLPSIRSAAEAYQNNWSRYEEKAREWVSEASDALLTGSAGTVYLKRMGHRTLSLQDVERLVLTFGDEADRSVINNFHRAQQQLNERLAGAKVLLILKQADIPYHLFDKRKKSSTLWTPEQMIRVIAVLEKPRL